MDSNEINKKVITVYNNIKVNTKSKGLIIKTNYSNLILDFANSNVNNYKTLLSNDQSNFKNLAKNAVNMFRKSIEYKFIIDSIREEIYGMDKCVVFNQLEDVELHHTPLTIFDMATFIIIRKIKEQQSFTSYDIAEELMQYHDQLKVGLVPLSKSIHKLVHERKFKVSINHVYGNWLGFFEEFKDYIKKDVFLAFVTKLELINERYETSLLAFKKDKTNINMNYNKDNINESIVNNLNSVNIQSIKSFLK